jgi:hypothetical protein
MPGTRLGIELASHHGSLKRPYTMLCASCEVLVNSVGGGDWWEVDIENVGKSFLPSRYTSYRSQVCISN